MYISFNSSCECLLASDQSVSLSGVFILPLSLRFGLGNVCGNLFHEMGANIIRIEPYAAIANFPEAQEPLLWCSWDWLQEKHNKVSLADEMPEEAAEIGKNERGRIMGHHWQDVDAYTQSRVFQRRSWHSPG